MRARVSASTSTRARGAAWARSPSSLASLSRTTASCAGPGLASRFSRSRGSCARSKSSRPRRPDVVEGVAADRVDRRPAVVELTGEALGVGPVRTFARSARCARGFAALADRLGGVRFARSARCARGFAALADRLGGVRFARSARCARGFAALADRLGGVRFARCALRLRIRGLAPARREIGDVGFFERRQAREPDQGRGDPRVRSDRPVRAARPGSPGPASSSGTRSTES